MLSIRVNWIQKAPWISDNLKKQIEIAIEK